MRFGFSEKRRQASKLSGYCPTHTSLAIDCVAIAVPPQDTNCAWFAPAISDERRVPVDAALFVSRTRDGGKTFEALRHGLPQKNCYDLVYRHAFAVAADGLSLLMGSTTGGLWLSEDAGDTWQEITHTLPPIYALAFA